MDPRLNELLKWGIENSDTSTQGQEGQAERKPPKPIDPEVLNALFGGPSEAELMKAAMKAVRDPEVDLENKLIAFDNFEQMVESLDNANNIEKIRPDEADAKDEDNIYVNVDDKGILGSAGLWGPLFEELYNPEPQLRTMAAWCIATAVQNNEKTQQKLVSIVHLFPNLHGDQKSNVKALINGDKKLAIKDLTLDQFLTLLQKLVDLAINDPDQNVRKKCILAISSGARNSQPVFEQLTLVLPDNLKPSSRSAEDMEAMDALISKLREDSANKA